MPWEIAVLSCKVDKTLQDEQYKFIDRHMNHGEEFQNLANYLNLERNKLKMNYFSFCLKNWQPIHRKYA